MASRSAPVDSGRGPFHTPSRRPRHFPGPGLGHQSEETWVPELADAVELDDPSHTHCGRNMFLFIEQCLKALLVVAGSSLPYRDEL